MEHVIFWQVVFVVSLLRTMKNTVNLSFVASDLTKSYFFCDPRASASSSVYVGGGKDLTGTERCNELKHFASE